MNKYNQQKSIFKINTIAKNDNEITANVSLLADSEIYKAHFPDNPITPGVCQLQLLKDCVKTVLETEHLMFKKSKFVKFINTLKPTEYNDVDVHILIDINGENCTITGKIFNKDTQFLKGRLEYAIEN